MAKIKVINKTTNIFYQMGYAFPPGEITTRELSTTELKSFKAWEKADSIAKRIKAGLLTIEEITKEETTDESTND
ncbi:hypothetical protein [uncultured Cetobacterium sp.]|uniref:hypothetical protein n=1 Tax=uncultured Cetobacterium sp. TaxID=527638 RepID=UPI00261DFD55|nr:hypothetical protein [uncultured Cetobacterium sp.]